MKKIFVAAALVLGTTSVSLAQGVYAAPGYGTGYYNYSPGYSYYNGGSRYGYRNDYYNNSSRDDERGGPGPRVGSGMGIGSQR
jgi:hypothetical protein